jgi:hypothetical protein
MQIFLNKHITNSLGFKMKKGLILLLMLLTTISVAIAVDTAGSSVTEIGVYGPITSTAAGTTNVSAGYIRETNLTAIMSTTRVAGIFGNVSGNIQLGDGVSNIMFAWTAEGNLVYVAENQPDWSDHPLFRFPLFEHCLG